MSNSEIKTLGVVGVGLMGSGIAQMAAMSGFDVLIHDISQEVLQNARNQIEKGLKRLASKGKFLQEDISKSLERIQLSTNLEDFSKAQLVIEAVSENEELKKKIFSDLNQICESQTILASNTSTIPIGRLASVVTNPERVIGMHFMNPVPLMKLVEIIRGFPTSDETTQRVCSVAEKMGKVVVRSKDVPGFIVNRILIPMINEAVYVLYEGVASAEEIDTAMKLGTNQPMGPLALADFIGLDTCLFIMEVIHAGLGDSKYRPCPLLRQYVEAGQYGKKTGKGFYTYAK